MQEIGLTLSLVLLVAALCQWAAWRARLPAILFLLLAGLVIGPVLDWVDPDALFGNLLQPMISLSVAIILFEGSLTLNFNEIRGVGQVVQRMITVGLDVSWAERGLLAWIAPRGIVAAAICSIFAEKLVALGYPDAALLVPLTFCMIIGTVVLQSATAPHLARWLGVAKPSPRGFLIIGANAFSRALARELTNHEYRCVLADTNRENIQQARMAGLETYFGNPVSEHAEVHLDLSGIGGLLGLSRQRHLNMISAIHFQTDFGANRVFSLAVPGEQLQADKQRLSRNYLGSQLFGEDITYSDLVGRVSEGQQVSSTRISDEFNWKDYQAKYKSSRLPLFLIDGKGIIKPFTTTETLEPGAGSIVIALVNDDERPASD